MIVSTEWLQDRLDEVRVVDIRGHVLPASEPKPHYFSHPEDYKASHIPGAVFVDWTSDLTDPDSPNGTQIAKPADYEALMSKLGIDEHTFVVSYDDAGGLFAARMWWSLNYYGHTKAAVLDGGWQKWIAENRPTTDKLPDITPTTFKAVPNPAIRRTIDEVAAALNTDVTLMDVRSIAEFNGEASRAKRAGHIPGAINLQRKTLLTEDGVLKSTEELQQQFQDAGMNPSQEVVVYCNGGVSATYGMLALKIAGYEHVAMYDGSWKEWGNDESRPIK